MIGFGVLVDRTQSAVSLLLHSAINKPSGKKVTAKEDEKKNKTNESGTLFCRCRNMAINQQQHENTKKTVKSLKAKNQNKTEMAHALKVSVKCNKKLALV